MTPYHKRVTAFTKRMAEDMQLRNMSPRTVDAYTYHVDRFALRFGKHPEELGNEQVREFQLWMINELKCSWSQFNQAVSALRFFYSVTRKRDWVVRQVPYGKRPKKLPVVLGNDEVARIIACVRNIKHRTVLLTLYSAGLRISEALNLQIQDIDSQRMMLRVQQAKGNEGSLCAHLTTITQGVADLLEGASSHSIPFSRQDRRYSAQQSGDSESLQLGNGSGQGQQGSHSPHFSAQLCDQYARSGCRPHGHQSLVGPQQLYHDDGLFTLSPTTSGKRAQPDRLAPSASMSTVDRSELSTTARTTEQPLDSEARPTVYSLIKQHTAAYMKQFGDTVCQHVESTLLRMSFCRTAALGSRTYRCDSCDYSTTVFNSCGDRHCPNCSGAKRRDWMESSTQLLVDGVTYFQVVFTLPKQLSSLALGNRQLMYDLLFKAAWESLKTKVEKERGIQAGALAVLHTWNQELGHHPHIHMMVPGNGLSLDGQTWRDVRLTRDGKPFLVDNTELGHDFRDLYLSYLTQAAYSGELKLEDSCYIADLLDDLRGIDWNVFIEGPPQATCPPEHMIRYLTRYLTGGPISDQRIIGQSDGQIAFYIRRRDKQAGQETFRLPAAEFVRRWTLHVLPKEFTKVRQFGCWTNKKRAAYLKASQLVLKGELSTADIELAPASVATSVERSPDATERGLSLLNRSKQCPNCSLDMRCVAQSERRAWRDLFYGSDHPRWFEWSSAGKCALISLDESEGEAIDLRPKPEEIDEPDIFDQMIELNRKSSIELVPLQLNGS